LLNFQTSHGKWQIHSTYSDNLRMATLSRGIEPLAYLVTLNLGQALGNPVWGSLSDRRIGRRGAVSLAAVLGVAAVPLFTLTTSPTIMWLGAVVMGLCGIGIWGMAPTYLTERFPTIARGVGPGLAYHAGAAIGWRFRRHGGALCGAVAQGAAHQGTPPGGVAGKRARRCGI
jgi:MFS family permease